MTTPDQREGGQRMEATGESFHMRAETAREEGRFTDALKDADEATVRYISEGNIIKASEVQSSRFLTLRHLWETTGNSSFRVLAQHAVESSVDMIRQTGESNGFGIPLYNLAKWHDTIGDYEKAIEGMKGALDAFEKSPEDKMGTSWQKAEITTRLASVQYRLGDDQAISLFDSALSDLITNPNPDTYSQNVWVSGAHMHLAEAMVARGQKDLALEQIGKARQIVDSDPRLSLRLGQLAKLSAGVS